MLSYLHCQENLASAILRERGVAEERGKGSMLLAAQQERSVMQEQVTFLKLQMQYALKVRHGYRWRFDILCVLLHTLQLSEHSVTPSNVQ